MKNREIRFKAYIKDAGIIVPVTEIYLTSKTLEVNTYKHYGDTLRYAFNEVELMQYIGLKDKNGKEIFENDIIKLSDKLHGYITFKEGKFIVIYIEKNLPKKIQDCGIYLSCYEVIGNIYENPELLKENK